MSRPLKLAACAAALVAGLWLAGCSDEPDREMFFLGDSIMEFWDVGRDFPTLRCHNCGKAGAGIEYLAGMDATVAGREVVLIIGTNDIWQCADDNAAVDYTTRYIQAVDNLQASRVYLFSVLPRGFEADGAEMSEQIARFNAMLRCRLNEFECEVVYIDLHARFCLDGTLLLNPQYSPDGLHINKYGYEIYADELWKRLK